MENELINIYDDNRKSIGQATRKDVHKKGYWHETFHCWFISRVNGVDYIYFQLRSSMKKDYPNLLDITAAGHILAHENIEDGVREIKEETGITVFINDLFPLGIIDYCVVRNDIGFIDKELAHVFIYDYPMDFSDFKLQTEEVTGMYKATLENFKDLWYGNCDGILIEGFKINQAGERVFSCQTVEKKRFVPHDNDYYQKVLKLIFEKLTQLS